MAHRVRCHFPCSEYLTCIFHPFIHSVEQEHHVVEKVKDKAQSLAALVTSKVKACTSPGVKTGEDQVASAVEEHEDVKE